MMQRIVEIEPERLGRVALVGVALPVGEVVAYGVDALHRAELVVDGLVVPVHLVVHLELDAIVLVAAQLAHAHVDAQRCRQHAGEHAARQRRAHRLQEVERVDAHGAQDDGERAPLALQSADHVEEVGQDEMIDRLVLRIVGRYRVGRQADTPSSSTAAAAASLLAIATIRGECRRGRSCSLLVVVVVEGLLDVALVVELDVRAVLVEPVAVVDEALQVEVEEVAEASARLVVDEAARALLELEALVEAVRHQLLLQVLEVGDGVRLVGRLVHRRLVADPLPRAVVDLFAPHYRGEEVVKALLDRDPAAGQRARHLDGVVLIEVEYELAFVGGSSNRSKRTICCC